jgi:hypothetical protein
MTFETSERLLAAEIDKRFKDLTFKPFQELKGDIKEVPSSAGRIKDARRTELVMKIANRGNGVLRPPFHLLPFGRCKDPAPVVT